MNKPALVIAVSGYKRSGKDTAAEYLVKHYGFKRLAFADPLKNSVALEFNLTRESIDDPAQKETAILSMPVSPKDTYSRLIAEFMYKEFRTKDNKTPSNFGYYGEDGAEDTFLGRISIEGATRAYKMETLYWTRRALCILKGSTMRSADPDYWVKTAASQARPGGLYVISDLRYKNEANALKNAGLNVITVRVNRFENSESNDPSERDMDDFKFDYILNNKSSLENFNLSVATLAETILGQNLATQAK